MSNSPVTASGGHRIAPPQRGICGGPQISWMGKAGEPSDLRPQAGSIIAEMVAIALPSSLLCAPDMGVN
jgi:hypothetical protein